MRNFMSSSAELFDKKASRRFAFTAALGVPIGMPWGVDTQAIERLVELLLCLIQRVRGGSKPPLGYIVRRLCVVVLTTSLPQGRQSFQDFKGRVFVGAHGFPQCCCDVSIVERHTWRRIVLS